MFIIARAVTYASIFIGLVLIFVPARLISWTGITRPESIGVPQIAGMVIGGCGAVLALAGAVLFYLSLPLLAYTVLFVLITHLFVVVYEEPTLGRTFGTEYEEYRQGVSRWWPRGPTGSGH